MTNWHQEVFNHEKEYLVGDAMEELDETLFELSDDVKPYFSDEPIAPRKTYNSLVYCEDCKALVGVTDECLCLSGTNASRGCGRTDRPCCGGSCSG